MERKKSLVKKKSKLPLIIGIIVALLVAGAAAFYFLYWTRREPVIVLTDAEYLMEVKSWEKQDAPTVIWTFSEDGKGELTTNKSNYYDFEWSLEKGEPQILKIQTAWLLDLDDSFEFVLDREAKSFTVKNQSDLLESTFVPLGTAEAAASAQTSDGTTSADAPDTPQE